MSDYMLRPKSLQSLIYWCMVHKIVTPEEIEQFEQELSVLKTDSLGYKNYRSKFEESAIRIAPGPPTEEGDYKGRPKHRKAWEVFTAIERHEEEFHAHFSDGRRMIIEDMVKAGWQFSTRIPDPEEME